MPATYRSTDEYIASFPVDQRVKMEEIRTIIRAAAPDAKEVISYNMPAFRQHTVLVYFAANKHHLGFYPTASPMTVFAGELKPFTTTKGSIHFPWDGELPAELIQRIVRHRLAEDALKAKKK